MRFYSCSAIALLVASLTSTPALADECESAWEHMKEVSRKELAGEPANVRDAAKTSFSDEARTRWLLRCRRGQIAARCVLAKKRSPEMVDCVQRNK